MTETKVDKLLPCRFCGTQPELFHYQATCPECLHTVFWEEEANSPLMVPRETLRPFIIKFWNKRNEKHNPFIEDK